jgi:SAM-dependent methyltransferase
MSLFPPGGTVLDVGGGNGFVARDMEANGYPTVLLEPGARAAARARQRGIRRIIRSTLADAKFKPNVLPAVGVFDVLEHVADEREFLRSIHESLRPGGRLYLTAPAYRGLWSDDDMQAGHFRRYTLKRLAAVLREIGYAVEYQTYIFSALVVPLFVVRAAPAAVRSLVAPGNAPSVDPGRHHESGPWGRVLRPILDWEIGRIGRKKAVPLGSSCLVVASKPTEGAGQ